MAERGALKALDPNAKKASKGGLGGLPSKIPRTVNKTGEADSTAKQELEARLNEVLSEYDELALQYSALEEQNRKLQVEGINLEEEASEWKKSYESLQTEGTELFQTYERKCAMLKEVSRQLEDYKSKVVERDERLKNMEGSLESVTLERDELREKAKAHSEVVSKHESRYLTLKDEHNQTLAKLDALQHQLREAQRNAMRIDGTGPAAAMPATSVNTTELSNMQNQLNEANMREKRACEELQSVKQQVQKLMAQQSAQSGACTSPLSASEDAVGNLPVKTPLRMAGMGNAPPKTPSGAMLEMDSLSPDSLRERAESLLISNDLLRDELLVAKREQQTHEETLTTLNDALREHKAWLDEAKKAARLAAEQQVAAEEERDVAQAEAVQARDRAAEESRTLAARVAELENKAQQVDAEVVQELEGVKAQLAAAEASKEKTECELNTVRKQNEAQAAAAKNAENDMRLMYKRHKKELAELQDKFKAGELEERYRVATHKAMQMEALVHKWVAYARELGEVRALQQKRAAAIETSKEAMQAVLQEALRVKEDAKGKVDKWRRQCKRMEKDMTKLVAIKTRALEERKELHDKYLDLYQELQAQDEYAQKLEENHEALKDKLSAQAAQEVAAAEEQAVERVRVEMNEQLSASQGKNEELVAQKAALHAEVGKLEAALAAAKEGAVNEAAAAAAHSEEVTALRAEVEELRKAAEQHDAIFEGNMLEMQTREEAHAALEEQLRGVEAELAHAKTQLADAQAFGESERAASQEALDELTKDLSLAHEQLASVEAQLEEAERRAEAAQSAAACGVARLTHVTVGCAEDEDNSTEMIDPELRLHWCDIDYEQKLAQSKTPAELRALLVGVASTVESLLTSGLARRDELREQVRTRSEELDQLKSSSAQAVAAAQAAELEREQATNDLLIAVERGEALQARVVAEEGEVQLLRQQVEELGEETRRLNALLEDTSRENVELSVCKDELVKLRPERDALQGSLDACMSKLSQAVCAPPTPLTTSTPKQPLDPRH
jgi:chromosome segregation ATPase